MMQVTSNDWWLVAMYEPDALPACFRKEDQ